MRGANRTSRTRCPSSIETSPHAWSKPASVPTVTFECRNISTCVEQTMSYNQAERQIKKHLHMRGANLLLSGIVLMIIETSPHAWSKPDCRSASAPPSWKHLHMRGANDFGTQSSGRTLETSPHAWSKLFPSSCIRRFIGNISTCVEQTEHWTFDKNPDEKYLHMRGANYVGSDSAKDAQETSPHAWSKHMVRVMCSSSRRNISTCVEQTATSRCILPEIRYM